MARATALLLLVATSVLATPFSQHAGAQSRNIRNLECVSRKSQEKGVCMFALSCLKLNGTHLGVCVDRFYYGSCCKLPEPAAEVDLAGDTNDIQNPGTVLGFPGKRPVTAASVVEEEPSSSTAAVQSTTAKPAATTSAKPAPAATTKRPTSVSKPINSTTAKPAASKPTVKPVTQKPTAATTKRPVTSAATTTKRPPVTKPTPAPPKPVSSPPKPPPKNQTSTVKPTAPPKPASTSIKPVSSPAKPSSTPKPASSTQKPSSSPPKLTTARPSSSKPPSKPTTTKPPSKPATAAATTAKPVLTTAKPTTAKPVPTTAKPVPTTAKPKPTTAKPEPTTTLSNEVLPSSVSPSQAPVVEAVEEETNVVSGTKPTPPTFSTGRPTPPTFPRPSSSTAPPEATSAQPSTEDGWVEIGLTTTSSVTTPPAAPPLFPGSMVTEEIPTSSATPPVTSASTPELVAVTPEDQSLNMTDFKQVCGRRLIPDGRIVGGTRSSFGKWPWQISLRQWRTSTYLHKCGAALLNDNWAITAAHCVENVPPSDLLLRLGEHDLSTESEPYSHLERRVQIVASHPQFDSRTFEYDLALLRFYEPVDFKPNVVPICIPDNDRNFVGSNAFVTGWGRLYEDGPLPSVMQEVSVPVIENAQCETMYRSAGYIEHIPNIFICAGWKKGGFDSCEGDSGGPMVIQREDKRWVLAGVISWGIGCAEPNQPGVYTRISEFRDWINQILQF